MWQVLLAAAVAGSTGLVAKHVFGAGVNPNETLIAEELKKCDESCVDREESDGIVKFEGSIDTEFGSPMVSNGLNESEREGIFRFSSSDSRGATSSRLGSKNLRKKTRSRCRGAAKQGKGKNVEVENCAAREMATEPKKSSGRFSVLLKKRRITKNLGASKSESCSSKGKLMRSFEYKSFYFCLVSRKEQCRQNHFKFQLLMILTVILLLFQTILEYGMCSFLDCTS